MDSRAIIPKETAERLSKSEEGEMAALAQVARGLFQDHCENVHGGPKTINMGCQVCYFWLTGISLKDKLPV